MNVAFNKTILDDLVGFIRFSQKYRIKTSVILCTILHDCRGILLGPSCFLPRVNGYRFTVEKTTVKKLKKNVKKN